MIKGEKRVRRGEQRILLPLNPDSPSSQRSLAHDRSMAFCTSATARASAKPGSPCFPSTTVRKNLERLDEFQIFVAHAVRRSRVERREEWMFGTALDQDRSVVFIGTIGQEKLEFVHTFEVPFQGTVGPIQLKGHLAAGAFDHSADFQMALGATGELNQCPDIIFVGYRWRAGRRG